MSAAAKTWTVRIYLMQRGCDVWRWLCTRCLKALEAEGWAQRKNDDPPGDLRCDGEACKAARAKVQIAMAA